MRRAEDFSSLCHRTKRITKRDSDRLLLYFPFDEPNLLKKTIGGAFTGQLKYRSQYNSLFIIKFGL